MRKLSLRAVGAALAGAAVVLVLGACNWQVPESMNIKGSPGVVVPGGSVDLDLDEFNELLDDLTKDFDEGFGVDSGFTVGELFIGDDTLPGTDGDENGGSAYDGKPFRIFTELAIEEDFDGGDIPGDFGNDFDVGIDGETDPIDLSDVFGPLSDLFKLDAVPGRLTINFTDSADAEDTVDVRLRAEWTDANNGSHDLYLISDDNDDPLTFEPDNNFEDFNLEKAFNDRPDNLVLHYELATDNNTSGEIGDIVLRIEIPFRFTVETDDSQDYVLFELDDGDDDNGDDDDNPLLMEDDIFGRDPDDPDEDLQELLDSLKGSFARMAFDLDVNTTGIDRVTLAMINSLDLTGDDTEKEAFKTDPDNWTFSAIVGPTGKTVIELGADAFSAMIDGKLDTASGVQEYIPEFLILFQDDDGFQLNRDSEFKISNSSIRAKADLDYTFDLD